MTERKRGAAKVENIFYENLYTNTIRNWLTSKFILSE